MSSKWFANRGQVVQCIAAVVSACVALVSLYFVLKSNNSLPQALRVLYVSSAVLLLLIASYGGRYLERRSLQKLAVGHSPGQPKLTADPVEPSAQSAQLPSGINVTIAPNISQTANQDSRPTDLPLEMLRRKVLRQADVLEKREEETRPNVGCLKPEVRNILYDDGSDVWGRRTGPDGYMVPFSAVVIPFSNQPRQGVRTLPVEGLRARLTYYKADGIEEVKRVDSGCWLGEAYRSIDLDVGAIAYLIAAVQTNFNVSIVANPRFSSARYEEDRSSVDPIPEGKYELKVELTGGDHGEYYETYWFRLDAGADLRLQRTNQTPPN